MPRIGMEPIRRKALMEAAIAEIGAHGSLDVTVERIARRAGVSAGLAHHYFGGKDQLIVATMRYLLKDLGGAVGAALRGVEDGRARISAILQANFTEDQFAPATVAAWLSFYVKAQSSPAARRLLKVYARRLDANLTDSLHRIMPHAEARRVAEGVAALIDGLYIRRALDDRPPDPATAIAVVERYVDIEITALNGATDGNAQ